MATKSDRLNAALADFKNNTDDVNDCAVISKDGLVMASLMSQGVAADKLGASVAALSGIAKKSLGGFKLGNMEYTAINGDSGYLVVIGCGDQATLGVTTRSDANLGMLLMGVREAASEIADIF